MQSLHWKNSLRVSSINYCFHNHWPRRLLIKLKTFCSLSKSICTGCNVSGGNLSDLVSAEVLFGKGSCQPQTWRFWEACWAEPVWLTKPMIFIYNLRICKTRNETHIKPGLLASPNAFLRTLYRGNLCSWNYSEDSTDTNIFNLSLFKYINLSSSVFYFQVLELCIYSVGNKA